MSKNKAKIIKPKKKFTIRPLIPFFRTLYKNDAIVSVATSTKWFWSIILFVLSAIISVIPITVQTSQTQGNTYINGGVSDAFCYGLDDYVNNSTDEQSIIFTKDGLLDGATKNSQRYNSFYMQGDASKNVYKPLFSYERNGSNMLDNYVVSDGIEDLNVVIENITNSNTNYGDATEAEDMELKASLEDLKYTRTSSFILFTRNAVYSRTYKSSTASTSLSGNFNHLVEAFPSLEGRNTFTLKDVLTNNVSTTASISEKQDAYLDNFKKFSDYAYIDQRTKQTWVSFGIYIGINGGLMLIMGLVTFLMTRGKNNPNTSINFLECFSMAFWAGLSPAVLSLILGFLVPSFGMMTFLMFYSFRIMFLSMRHLRPAY